MMIKAAHNVMAVLWHVPQCAFVSQFGSEQCTSYKIKSIITYYYNSRFIFGNAKRLQATYYYDTF